MRRIMVPGLGGSDSDHWQSQWEQQDPSFSRFAPSSWDAPWFDDWAAALDAAVGDEPAVVVTHSLGCLLAVRWNAANPGRLAGLFLVAPPDPWDETFPTEAESFLSGLDVRVTAPAVVVSSDDDPYCSAARARELAAQWGTAHVSVGDYGHLNAASGVGAWQEGRNLFTAFAAGLGAAR